MEFVTIEKSRYLSVDMMNAIYNNIKIINSLLTVFGLKSARLKDSSVTYNTYPTDILNKMNAVESNITAIHNEITKLSDWNDKYYEVFIWQRNTPKKRKEVDRWIDWINDVYLTIQSKTHKELLSDINGEQIFDINNEKIYTTERNI